MALAIAGVLILAVALTWLAGGKRPPRAYLAAERPLNMAHRGGAALFPENTLFAFRHAAELGSAIMETDTHATLDGVEVLIHDATVDRTTDGHGAVRDMTWVELRKLDAAYRFSRDGSKTFPFRGQGIRIPSLKEALAALPIMRFNVEIKPDDPSLADSVLRVIREANAEDRVLVASEHADVLRRFRRLAPDIATSFGSSEVRVFWILNRLRLGLFWRPNADALQVPETYNGRRIVSPSFVAAAHRKGVQVHVFDVETREQMERLLDMGVSGVITNHPDLLETILDEKAASGKR